MNFDFSDDQKLLKEQVRKFLADKCPTKVVRRVLDGNETHAEEVWKGLVDLGVPGVGIPEEYRRPRPVAARALRRRRGDRPRRRAGAVRHVGRAGDRSAEARGLRRAEEEVAAAAGGGQGDRHAGHRRGPAAARPRNIRTTFGGGRLNGKKVPVADGEAATFAVVLANTGGARRSRRLAGAGRSQAIAGDARSASRPSIRRASMPSSPSTPPRPSCLGAEGEGWRLLERLYDAAAVYFAFAQVGGAEAAMWMARDYALQRQAFGRAIGSYQAIKHKLADCYVKLELARSNAYYGAMMLTDGGADLPLAAAAARIAATEAYDFAVEGEHPDPWRHRLHLGGRHAVPLPPRARDGAVDRRADGLEGQAGDAAGAEERGVSHPIESLARG